MKNQKMYVAVLIGGSEQDIIETWESRKVSLAGSRAMEWMLNIPEDNYYMGMYKILIHEKDGEDLGDVIKVIKINAHNC